MFDGFIKVSAISPKVKLADPKANSKEIISKIKEASKEGAKVIVFPELCTTGYSCGDLFLQESLITENNVALSNIIEVTKDIDAIIFLGTVWKRLSNLYNAVIVISRGNILGIVPKNHLVSDRGLNEPKYFTSGTDFIDVLPFDPFLSDDVTASDSIPFGTDILFTCKNMPSLVIGVEVGSDNEAVLPNSAMESLAGATLIINPSDGCEIIESNKRKSLSIAELSRRYKCAYISAGAGFGESTTAFNYTGFKAIYQNGDELAKACARKNDSIYAVIDTNLLSNESRNMVDDSLSFASFGFKLKVEKTKLVKKPSKHPFIPDEEEQENRFRKIIDLQARSLVSRMKNIGVSKAVLGLSGGLDSTLALLVCKKAFDIAGFDKDGLILITMPGLGTSATTKSNAIALARELNLGIRDIDISSSIKKHFNDINHNENDKNITYENAQARERAQVLFDIANDENAIVIGTSDMSELALGFTTYGGDHMSSYNVNAGIPKTLVKSIIRFYPEKMLSQNFYKIMDSIASSPVSPELLPGEDGEIAQKTEDIIGPYELHDFILYYMIRYNFTPTKIFRLAKLAFKDEFNDTFILETMKTFYSRFFASQFKRSASPDYAKIGSVCLNGAAGFEMPSDALAKLWIKEIKNLLDSKEK